MAEFKSPIVNGNYSEDVYSEWFDEADMSGVKCVCDDMWIIMARRAKEPMEDLLGYEYENNSPIDDFLDFLLMTTIDKTVDLVVGIVSEETSDDVLIEKIKERLGVLK